MLIRRGFKFELKPNGMQSQLMKQFCGCARYVYNRTLSLERSLYKKDNKHSFKYAEAVNRLPEWKKKSFFKRVSQSSSSAIAEGPGSGLHQFFFGSGLIFRSTRKNSGMTPSDFRRALNLMRLSNRSDCRKSAG